MELRSYLNVALSTTLNVILYALTCGRFVWLEGRVRGGVFTNWARRFRYRPARFARPTTEDEIIEWLYAWWERIDEWIAAHKDDALVGS